MNSRVIAIGSGLFVVATATGLIGPATAAAGVVPAPVRPADSNRIEARRVGVASIPVGLPAIDPAVRAHDDTVKVARFAAAVNTARWFEAVAAMERARVVVSRPTSPAQSSGNVLDCIKHRESRGQYGVVNSSSGAAGAYQFMPGTWDNNARSAGRNDLVGVNPANARAADQDAMAQHLLATQGLGPWGGGCG